MQHITLEEEEEGGLALEGLEEVEQGENFCDYNAKLCLVGRFLSEGVMDFQAMQQTLAALWKPGRGVYIKEVDVNLYLFQFYHEIDIKRVVDGSPWSFNRKTLIIARMKEGDIPRSVSLNTLDLWVQIYDLRAGFMSERVIKEVGNYIGNFIESWSGNFEVGWKEYFHVRVKMNLSIPLKRRMKLRKSGEEWVWISFKYENVPTFCFICGILGHSDKFCSRLFDTPEAEIVKPYGAWMRAPFRKPVKQIGARWLREGGAQAETKFENQETGGNHGRKVATENPGDSDKGGKIGAEKMQSIVKGAERQSVLTCNTITDVTQLKEKILNQKTIKNKKSQEINTK